MKRIILLLALIFIGLDFTYAQSEPIQDQPNLEEYTPLLNTMYGDVKKSLEGLSEALKIGTDRVYYVLVKQQYIKSTYYVIFMIISYFMIINYINKYKSNEIWLDYSSNKEGTPTIVGVLRTIQIVVSGLFLLIFLSHIPETITGFINPEYGAIKEIIEWVK
jgi:hypothetical protein